ncbi:putative carbonic anhydrase [Helianthus anomalus]
MSNTNPSTLLFIYLMIISSQSVILICKADASNETGLLHRLWPASKNYTPHATLVDNPKKTLNRPPLRGMQPISKGEEFNYLEGNPRGPKNWGNLNPDWKTCADGKSQSPINIDVKRAHVMPGDLKRAYIDAPARLVNGHDNIGIEWLGDAGGIQVNGSTYKLHQCHWHTPSEHKIDGKKFDAELHIVHKNDKGQKAVISTLHTVGQSDPFIGSLTKKINMLGTKEEIDLGKISATSIKHESKKYYRYIGSFTTPPCTEGVIWTIEEKVRSISKDQIKLLKGLHQRESRQNARPLQQLGGRPIWIFDIPEEKG